MEKTRILFLCTGNSCRSQMAEGWAKFLKGDRIEAASAGVEPRGLDPRAVRVMAEAGVDISAHRSKHLSAFLDRELDYAVTVCGGADALCPVFPGPVKRVRRVFDDPPRLARDAAGEEEALAHYRRVRDEIRDFVAALPQSLEEWNP
jgi:arsenate reductase